MKVKFGALVVDGRNKIGGHVLSKNRGGAYMRTKVTPVNPQTSYQTAVRATFTSLSQSWRTQTQAQILAWNAATPTFAGTDIFGDVKNPSGFNLYKKLNQNLATVGASPITAPPVLASAPSPVVPSITAVAGAGTIALVFTPSPVPAGFAMVVEACAPQSPGKTFVKNQFRIIATVAAGQTTPQAEGVHYSTKFGAWAVGQKIFFRCKLINITTGESGLPAVCSAIST